MFREITENIQVTVYPEYLEEESAPEDNQYIWAYTVEIENLGQRAIQVLGRHWKITDANGLTEEVIGPGIVGEEPIIYPGEIFEYTSGTPLNAESGIMFGSYQARFEKGGEFSIKIPPFSLDIPDAHYLAN